MICFSISSVVMSFCVPAHQILDSLRVEHDGLQVGAGHLDNDVLIDEVDSLRTQRMPHQTAGDVGGPHRLVNVCQPTGNRPRKKSSIGSGLIASHSCDTTL